jgi:hypothetical protein
MIGLLALGFRVLSSGSCVVSRSPRICAPQRSSVECAAARPTGVDDRHGSSSRRAPRRAALFDVNSPGSLYVFACATRQRRPAADVGDQLAPSDYWRGMSARRRSRLASVIGNSGHAFQWRRLGDRLAESGEKERKKRRRPVHITDTQLELPLYSGLALVKSHSSNLFYMVHAGRGCIY